jgi:hypothetical protein
MGMRSGALFAAMLAASVAGAAVAVVVINDANPRLPVAAPSRQPAAAGTVTMTAAAITPTGSPPPTTTAGGAPTPPPPETVVPQLGGLALDVASTALSQNSLRRHVDGGGLFGVLDDANWTVCATTPPAGARVPPNSVVTVHVDRSC